jgi:hypothetical protein
MPGTENPEGFLPKVSILSPIKVACHENVVIQMLRP